MVDNSLYRIVYVLYNICMFINMKNHSLKGWQLTLEKQRVELPEFPYMQNIFTKHIRDLQFVGSADT